MTSGPEPLWTDIAQAWGTIAGATFSFAAALAAGWLVFHEVRKRIAEERDAESAQARLVLTELTPDQADEGKHVSSVRWRIDNFSNKPIRGIIVSITRDDHPEDSFSSVRLRTIPPGGNVVNTHRPTPPVRWDIGADRSNPPMHKLHLHLEFMDANGLLWTTTDGEMPSRLLPPGPPPWRRPMARIRYRRQIRRAMAQHHIPGA